MPLIKMPDWKRVRGRKNSLHYTERQEEGEIHKLPRKKDDKTKRKEKGRKKGGWVGEASV